MRSSNKERSNLRHKSHEIHTHVSSAFQTGDLQWTNDVDGDSRWTRHPKADPTRSYNSLASMPIVVSDEVVAILNVLSTRGGAFLKGDLTYIELLGTLLGLTWTLRATADTPSTLGESDGSVTTVRKGD